MTLIIPGKPMGKQRPRVLKSGITYTPQRTVNYETLVKEIFATECKLKKPSEKPIRLEIRAYFQMPQSISKKKREEMLKGKIRPTQKPDVDNIVKIIADALNGLAYLDDKQIISCNVEKYYSDTPRVEINIEEVIIPDDDYVFDRT